MYVAPIGLDLLWTANQISCCEGEWCVGRFDPDTVQNGHICSSMGEEELFMYWAYFDFF